MKSGLTGNIPRFQEEKMYKIAEIYSIRVEKDKAFKWLVKAYSRKDFRLFNLKVIPYQENWRAIHDMLIY